MSVTQWKLTEPWLQIACKLGEHPFYEASSDTLRFVDVVKKQLHFVNLSEGPSSLTTLQLEDAVGCSADISGLEDQSLIVGAKYGYAYMDRKTGALNYIAGPSALWNALGEDVVKKSKRVRANDGNIDPQGRFWLGMMNDPLVKNPVNEGAVFVLERDGTVRRAIDKATIPNGIGWSDDEKTMYFVDSPTKALWAYDFDGSSGQISNPREWWRVGSDEPEDAVPDGFCQDVQGHIWLAIHGGSKVVRLKEDGNGYGVKVGEVLLPTRCPTCPRIIGTELYVTSSQEEDPVHYPQSVSLAGAVFKVDVSVRGIDMRKWTKRESHALDTETASSTRGNELR